MKKENLTVTKFRDYYFMGMFEIGQKELIDVHEYTYLIDMCTLMESKFNKVVKAEIMDINKSLVAYTMFSTQKYNNYEKQLDVKDFMSNK